MQTVSTIKAGNHILVNEFIGALFVIIASKLLGLAQHPESLKMHALHQVWALDIKAGDDSQC